MTGPAARRRLPVAALIAFGILLALLLAHHEMWRDELQAWLLARDSGSPAQLWHNTRYEGHPLLWHLLLFPLAHATTNPAAMQVLHWAIAMGVAALVLFAGPLPAWARVALVFSYFPLFEYGAVSRNYALTVLGIWSAVALAARRSPGRAAAGGVLAANASPMGIVLAPALAAALWLSPAPRRWRLRALGALAVGAGLGALQCVPPADYEHARDWIFGLSAPRAVYVARAFATGLLPAPRWDLHFWGSSAIFPGVSPGGQVPAGAFLAALFLVAAVVAVGFAVRRSRAALAFWVVGTLSLAGFAYVKLPGAIRHWGFVWVVLVGAVWLAVAETALSKTAGVRLLAPTLVAGLFGSLVAGWWDWRAPFSAARCAATELRRQGLGGLPLVGGVDWASSGVAAYLPGGRLYYPASGSDGSFIVWNLARTRQDRLHPAEIVREAEAHDGGSGVVTLLNEPLEDAAAPSCRLAFRCGGTIVADESLFGYVCYGAR